MKRQYCGASLSPLSLTCHQLYLSHLPHSVPEERLSDHDQGLFSFLLYQNKLFVSKAKNLRMLNFHLLLIKILGNSLDFHNVSCTGARWTPTIR